MLFNIQGRYRYCTEIEGELSSSIPTPGAPPPGSTVSKSHKGTFVQFYRGDDLILRVILIDENGSAVDLTDSLIRFSVKREDFCEEPVFTARSDQGNEIAFLNAEEGLVQIHVPHTDTEVWEAGWPYWYDIEVTFNPNTTDAIRQTVIKDRLEILPDITI